ncbi:MAG TPA: L,D-transpeptidase [Gemmatimonadaceae bacterium]|nr:L,D-transpeptidase [Gemmatimonadaceae bacterium]
MSRIISFFKHGGAMAWGLIAAVIALLGVSTALFAKTADVRYQRDVTRMVFNDNLQLLEDVKRSVGAAQDTLEQLSASTPDQPADKPYIVVSIEDHRLWYKQGEQVLFETQVATGSGKVLEHGGAGDHWKFETPRGRLVVQGKDTAPAWVPPDWHFVEVASKKGLGIRKLNRGDEIPLGDGAVITVDGNDVVKRYPDGREVPFQVKEGKEIVANGNVIVPPFGTNQRKYLGVLGTHRLELGDGYGIHGTDDPSSIGKSASHGCVRLRNEDIETLYQMVPLGTPVYIY